ncbi:MAG: glucose-6-phosphate dehydrogenase [Candidatus Tectomicrobia bacterium]|uniref:Glucose-6-phosphate 1-dehydrogenase n=1 Tax=Tectimicrobiota bacterium TaxID=2528274 RepID=A0A938B0V1_UNCTE|nr:glucose-6-phosphate dehydrogenase [Candidatus Tectomicrobia bacterium]
MSEAHVETIIQTDDSAPARLSDPCVLVIFGASGDLTRRLLIPSLYNLAHDNLLSPNFAVVGVARNESSHEEFRQAMHKAVHESNRVKHVDPAIWDNLEQRLYYVTAPFQDPEGYPRVEEVLQQCDRDWGTKGNYLFYLATPPTFFGEIVQNLGRADLSQEREEEGRGWRRVIIEKPFGRDLTSARDLNRSVLNVFEEHQVYRIDHYLGKETVQNMLVFRFANGMLEPLWSQRYIDHVQITVTETVGVEGRGDYYDSAGLMRDMMQNHMFQLLALVAMEPPYSFASEAVRDEKAKVLHAVRPMTYEEVLTNTVRGQYGPGLADGHPLVGYRQEPRVPPNSNTETYAAVKLFIENWRWAGVPFYLRSGKAMPKRLTEVAIQFRQAPHMLFQHAGPMQFQANRLILHIQPREGISWDLEAKVPGPAVRLKTVSMDFNYSDFFGAEPSTGYETLLYDAMIGDATLFQRDDIVEAAWNVAMPILDVWQALPARDYPNYPARQSWGPQTAEEFIRRDGRTWRQF